MTKNSYFQINSGIEKDSRELFLFRGAKIVIMSPLASYNKNPFMAFANFI